MDNQAYLDMLLAGLITVKKVVTTAGAIVLRELLTTRPYQVDIKREFDLATTDRYYGPAFLRGILPHKSTEICRENWRN